MPEQTEKFHQLYEVQTLIDTFHTLPPNTELALSLTNIVIDFLSNYINSRTPFDAELFMYLINLLGSDHSPIRERAQKAIVKLMIKNNHDVRKALLLRLNSDPSPVLKQEIDKSLECAFSPLYFGWGNLTFDQDETEDDFNETDE